MTRTFEFICEHHEDFGFNGWRLRTQPNYDPIGGMGVAHDILEHFPGSTESPADEFQALGCSYWLRGEGGYDERGGDFAYSNPASDFGMIFSNICHKGHRLSSPPTVPADSERDQAMTEIRQLARINLMAETEWQREQDEIDEQQIDRFLDDAIGWMKVGYRRAVRRYARYARHNLVCLFRRIEIGADRLLKQSEVGATLTIRVNLAQAEAHLSVAIEEDDYQY